MVLVEQRCADIPSVPCAQIEKMPDGTVGPEMPDGKSGCINFCKSPGDTCPVHFLDFCKSPEDYCPIATGFIMKLCGLAILISNRHVLAAAQGGKQIFIRARLKSGEPIRLVAGEIHGHPNPNVDIAACRLHFPLKFKEQDIVIGIIYEDEFRKHGKSVIAPLSSVRAGDQAVFAGFPLVIGGVRALVADREIPLIRSGIVSIVLPGDTKIGNGTFNNIFLMDSWAFRGNSGSPVIIPPTPIGYQTDERDRNKVRLVGVVSAFLDLNAPIEKAVVAGGVQARVNSGLAIVQSLDGFEDMVQQFKGAQCTQPVNPNADDREGKTTMNRDN